MFGHKGSSLIQGFQAAAADVQAIGLTFGGCFFGHGAYVASGSARFIMTGFSVQ